MLQNDNISQSADKLQDMMRGQVLGDRVEEVRLPPLDVEDALQIGRVAKYAQRLDKQVHSPSQRPLALAFINLKYLNVLKI